MNRKEPPRGGRMLKKTEDKAHAVERERSPAENDVANTQDVRDAKPRGTRKRRKPFVL